MLYELNERAVRQRQRQRQRSGRKKRGGESREQARVGRGPAAPMGKGENSGDLDPEAGGGRERETRRPSGRKSAILSATLTATPMSVTFIGVAVSPRDRKLALVIRSTSSAGMPTA